jgi:hypothetical protein
MSIFKTLTNAQAQGVGYFGALVTSVSAWSVERIFSTVGLFMGLITFLVGLYASRRRIKRGSAVGCVETKWKPSMGRRKAGFPLRCNPAYAGCCCANAKAMSFSPGYSGFQARQVGSGNLQPAIQQCPLASL